MDSLSINNPSRWHSIASIALVNASSMIILHPFQNPLFFLSIGFYFNFDNTLSVNVNTI
jgi:hypothetical protein